MTVYLVISLPKIPYIHHIYMVLANPAEGERMRERVPGATSKAVAFPTYQVKIRNKTCQV
jgi:hypothetical protein